MGFVTRIAELCAAIDGSIKNILRGFRLRSGGNSLTFTRLFVAISHVI